MSLQINECILETLTSWQQYERDWSRNEYWATAQKGTRSRLTPSVGNGEDGQEGGQESRRRWESQPIVLAV